MAAPMLSGMSGYFRRACSLCGTSTTYSFNRFIGASSSVQGQWNPPRRKKKGAQRHRYVEPIELSPEEEVAVKRFRSPKSLLHNTFSLIPNKQISEYKFRTRTVNSQLKMCQITLQYPEEFQVVGHGRRKSEAENVAAAVACAKLMDYGVLDEKLRPVMPEYGVYSQMQIREFVRRETLPMWLRIDEELQNDITNALDNWKSCNVRQDLHEDTVSNDVIDNSTDNEDMYKMREYLSEEDLDRLLWKSDTMRQHLEFLENDESLSRKKMRESVAKLPILAMRSEIYSAIENNQVIVLEGDTGCGKTTQVPQIILDEYIRNGRGAHCNIVVTQPRRISAVSIAERVSDERAERVGQTVGYQVRLENRLPEKDGSVLFCTVGILLKKIQSNPSLNGVTHVIVDEVHERDVNTDFLLILLKELVQKNSDIKIILMSASINTHMFSKYFNNCPIISVPGLMYPVKEYFLEDVFRMVGDVQRRNGNGRPSFDKPDTNWEMVSRVIEYIDTNKPHGAILCFLPGWQDIVAVRNRLQELWPSQDLHWIFPVHSSVPMSQQQAIFEKPPEGVRKVVLATNIAETSITINDVVYVVNVGNHKELRYNIETGTSCLDVHWISRANVRQRKGRAGRCQPGECYHLFTENKLQDMDDFQLAEMLRVPLEQLIVQTKIHTPHTIVAEFLEKALEPPSEDAVEKAVDLLQDLDILDDDENLTPLGKKISHITTDPRLAKAIVYSAIFRCVDPILTISASLSSRDPYMDSLERRSEVNLVKRRFSGNSKSDHIGLLNVFSEWLKFSMHNRHDGRRFAMDNILHHGSLNFIKGLRRQFSENLYDAGMVNFEKSGLMYVDGCNENSDDQELIKGVLAAALYPNIVYVRRGEIINDKLKLNSVICKDLDNNRIILHPSSVNSDEKKFPHRWLTYFTKTKSSGTFIRDSSMVHPMVLICLAGKSLCVLPVRKSEAKYLEDSRDDVSEPVVKLVLDNNDKLSFYTTEKEAGLLMDVVEEIDNMVLDCLTQNMTFQLPKPITDRHTELLDIVKRLVNTYQQPYIADDNNEKRDSKKSEEYNGTLFW